MFMDLDFTKLVAPTSSSFINVAPFYDELMSDVPYERWADYLEELFDKRNVFPRTILDIGCGTGAITLEMVERGYECVGVDISEPMLAQARKSLSETDLEAEFHRQDAAELSLPGRSFDAIISLFDSLNYIIEPSRLVQAFFAAKRHLGQNGIFIFDMNTEFAFQAKMFDQSSTIEDDSMHYIWKSDYDNKTKLCNVDMTFRKVIEETGENLVFRENHVQRAYSVEEVISGLMEAGFTTVDVHDAFHFRPPQKTSDRIYFVAT
jgi:ubiquinone/menaquinone biosynthesis C-methylase UbiE